MSEAAGLPCRRTTTHCKGDFSTTDMNRRSALRTGLFGAVAATAAGTVGMAHAAAPAAEMGVKTLDFDLVVIGAGCAGMTAALEAADAGAKVALLEKRSAPFGNTI